MGSCCTKEEDGGKMFPKVVQRDPTNKWSFESRTLPPRQKITPEEKIERNAMGKEGEVVTRPPGSLRGQQMQIENCKNCDFFLCDEADSVIVDDCENCRFFIGPCSGSVFLRTTKNCAVVVAAGQVRLRDCGNLQMLVYCQSRPVIESSKNISVGCFDYAYFDLQQHMDRAKLSVFNNRWSVVHDFTPNNGRGNFSYLDPSVKAKDLLKPHSQFMPELPESSEGDEAPVVPRTWGSRPLPSDGECAFALFMPSQSETCATFINDIRQRFCELTLTDTKELLLNLDQAKNFLQQSTLTKPIVLRILSGPVIGVGVYGERATLKVQQMMEGHPPTTVYVAKTAQEAQHMAEVILDAHKSLAELGE